MAWVRERVERLGLSEEIARLAYVRYLALYASDKKIDSEFDALMYGEGNDKEAGQ